MDGALVSGTAQLVTSAFRGVPQVEWYVNGPRGVGIPALRGPRTGTPPRPVTEHRVITKRAMRIPVQGYRTGVRPMARQCALRCDVVYVVSLHSGVHASHLRQRLRSFRHRALRPSSRGRPVALCRHSSSTSSARASIRRESRACRTVRPMGPRRQPRRRTPWCKSCAGIMQRTGEEPVGVPPAAPRQASVRGVRPCAMCCATKKSIGVVSLMLSSLPSTILTT